MRNGSFPTAACCVIALGTCVSLLSSLYPVRVAPVSESAASALHWPQPRSTAFRGCPAAGDGGDRNLNLRENRIDSGRWQAVALARLLGLTWPRGIERKPRSLWSAPDAARVAREEGRPISTEGYLLAVLRVPATAANCHDPAQAGYQAWLTVSSRVGKAHALVVVFTARVMARNPNLNAEQAIPALAGRRVRVAGWLLLDQEHPDQLGKTRATLWEVHPAMQIQVRLGGAWIELHTKQPFGTAVADGSSTPIATPSPMGTAAQPTPTSIGISAPTALPAAVIHISSGGRWQPPSVSVAPGATVTWVNDDPHEAHPLECLQSRSSATCPWAGLLALPPAQEGQAGAVPTRADATFGRPGIYTFLDALHPTQTGQVIVGAP